MKKKTLLYGVAISALTIATAASFGGYISKAASEDDPTIIKCNGTSVTVDGDGVVVDGSIITINTAGYYTISGTLTNGQLIIDADHDNDNVNLTLNGANITCANSAPFYVKSANKTKVSLQENTTNTLTDSSNYVYASADEDEPNAAMFAKDDLNISGDGKLTVNGNYKHGINCKDDLKIKGGTLIVNSVNDGIRGKDSLEITGGDITVNSKDDGIKAYNEDEDGYLTVSDAKLNISASDDGIKSESYITISDGSNITVSNSYEGIESKIINIEGGNVNVTSTDDGINASDGSGESFAAASGVAINISGGTTTINAEGDGVDSNGDIYMNAGTVYVDGPTRGGNGALDHNGTFALTGGLLVAAGSADMLEPPTQSATTQYVISATFTSTISANTKVSLQDVSGNEILSYTPSKTFQNVIMSSPDIKANTSYNVYTGSTLAATVTTSSIISYYGSTGNQGGFGGQGSQGGFTPGNQGGFTPNTTTAAATATVTPTTATSTIAPTAVSTATATPVSTSTTTPVATSSTSKDITASIAVSNEWSTGYVGSITITNNSSSAISDWKLSFDLADEITSVWGANIDSAVNGSYILSALSWNGYVGAGQSITFGFMATKSSSNVATASNIVVSY